MSLSSPLAQRALEVRELALRLMAQHGLADWAFRYNRRKRSLGVCHFNRRLIELSIHLVQRNEGAEILDTILHEIAHALVGPGHGHDAVWKRKCLEVGARPERCSYEVDMPEGRWHALCPACSNPFRRHRRPRPLTGWFCRRCGPERGSLTWQTVAPS